MFWIFGRYVFHTDGFCIKIVKKNPDNRYQDLLCISQILTSM